ncbi:MAG: acyl-CoA dehydrogenase domain protein [Hydrocarboniphaga sp.]|uniref:acyl-CoA dehydrogenase family protein n=1 Tax=Hydrocarboniphaga sp. TaxID=2033016 RepID=UPI00262DF1D4|nr:acyl-CoA dehydrogenase family protein [Hydrocarboniphaga sp.]MDB5968416.1 acyl-CoA dehydrogenase domain protein [Hydrocarboniphaga sp.]
MNLAFSEEELAIRDEFRRVLTSSSARAGLVAIQAQQLSCDLPLWQRLAQTGWLGAGVAEEHGGSALGNAVLCLAAEEIGRQSPAIPYVASVCGFAVALALADAPRAQAQWLPRIADGSVLGLVLMAQDWSAPPLLSGIDSADDSCTLSGATRLLRDGASASVALTLIGEAERAALLLLPLPAGERIGAIDKTLDLLHPPAAFRFDAAPAEVLATGDAAIRLWERVLDRYALFTAFEQLGGAQAALEMARDYSLTRYAFGRAIGSFQALKHSMADMLAAIELARSNCYFGAAALDDDEAQLPEAAAVARIAATDAFRLCAKQNMQIHGGIGVTWESDAHLAYRRAQSLATALGTPGFWKERLVRLLIAHRGSAARAA